MELIKLTKFYVMFIALINDSNVFVSLDVVSFFTTVPLKKTVGIILKHIYMAKKLQLYIQKDP